MNYVEYKKTVRTPEHEFSDCILHVSEYNLVYRWLRDNQFLPENPNPAFTWTYEKLKAAMFDAGAFNSLRLTNNDLRLVTNGETKEEMLRTLKRLYGGGIFKDKALLLNRNIIRVKVPQELDF